jgi:hypothetical protein
MVGNRHPYKRPEAFKGHFAHIVEGFAKNKRQGLAQHEHEYQDDKRERNESYCRHAFSAKNSNRRKFPLPLLFIFIRGSDICRYCFSVIRIYFWAFPG